MNTNNQIADSERIDHLEKLFKHCPHAEILFNEDPDDDSKPIGYSIRVAGCRESLATAPTLRESIDLDMQWSIEEAKDIPHARHGNWTKDVPTESGTYWHWNGDRDCMPIHLEIMYSGTSQSCFAPANQWGWTRAQEVAEMGGWWMPLRTPEPPPED